MGQASPRSAPLGPDPGAGKRRSQPYDRPWPRRQGLYLGRQPVWAAGQDGSSHRSRGGERLKQDACGGAGITVRHGTYFHQCKRQLQHPPGFQREGVYMGQQCPRPTGQSLSALRIGPGRFLVRRTHRGEGIPRRHQNRIRQRRFRTRPGFGRPRHGLGLGGQYVGGTG